MTESDPDTERLVALLAKRTLGADTLADRDWERILALARKHDLGPILYARLNERAMPPPRAIAAQLRDLYLASAARNTRLFHALGLILSAARDAAIPVIPLKGACLAEGVYANVALRPMADIDLLVRPAALPAALRLLGTLGYACGQPVDPAAAQAVSQDMPTMSRPGGPLVELHWTLVTPLCHADIHEPELEGLWRRARPATVAGVETLTLSPVDLLLHLCMHVSVHHRFNLITLRNFVDIAEACRRYESEMEWDEAVARANQWRVGTGVRMALDLAAEWTDLRIPSRALAGLGGGPVDGGVMAWAKHKVLNGTPAGLESAISRLEGKTRPAGKLGAIRDVLFLPRAVMCRLYPAPADSWRILAYYPVRWTDLWVRYRRALWKLATRDQESVADVREEARLRECLGWK
jgi:hypothetical protein